MELVKDKVRYWDQDVLNSYFDSKFLILSEEFNYSTATRPHYTKEYNAINDDVTFLHFSGNKSIAHCIFCSNSFSIIEEDPASLSAI